MHDELQIYLNIKNVESLRDTTFSASLIFNAMINKKWLEMVIVKLLQTKREKNNTKKSVKTSIYNLNKQN